METGSGSTRRRFLQGAGASGTLVLFGVTLAPLTGCGGRGEGGNERGESQDAAADAGAPDGAPARQVDPCSDLTGLNSEAREWRGSNGYVERTPDPAKHCENCEYWEPPRGDAPCGGCTVMAGPIRPGAYCDLWEARA
jgi:hypothetical protein